MTIDEICEKYGIENYTIMDDGSIDVDGDVNINGWDLDELPLTFNKVTGAFHCANNKLTDLKGSPKSVGGSFYCNDNELTDLKGSPKWVGGSFYCNHNNLTSLEGSPESVGGVFYCHNNNLTSLEGSPKYVTRTFHCANNNLTTLEGSPKSIGGGFYCHANPIGSIFDNVDIDFIRAFKTFKVLNDGVVDLKRLRYVMEIFDKPIFLDDIKKHYTIK
jgi:hypothetical protein